MLPQFLLPDTEARQDGLGDAVTLQSTATPLLLTLGITRNIQQAHLEVSIWGSPDGQQWRQLAVFPRKSYCGTYSTVLDLERHPGIRYVRAQWTMDRWGRGDEAPLFGFYLLTEQVQVQRAGAA